MDQNQIELSEFQAANDASICEVVHDHNFGYSPPWPWGLLKLPPNTEKRQWLAWRAEFPKGARPRQENQKWKRDWQLALHIQVQDQPFFTALTFLLAGSALVHIIFVRILGVL